jgi:hypothetical protein
MDKREEEKLVLAGDGYSRVVGRVYCAIATERGIERDTEKSRTRHDKKNMAVGRHRAPANIRSELVVIGALFTTDSHHRLPLRIFFFYYYSFLYLGKRKFS